MEQVSSGVLVGASDMPCAAAHNLFSRTPERRDVPLLEGAFGEV